MRRQRHMKLCREGWLYIGILAFVLMGAMMRQINLLIIFYGLLVGPLLINWRMVRLTLGRLEVRRRLPASVTAGDPLTVTIEASNPRRRQGNWMVSVTDRLKRVGAKEPPLEPVVLFPYIAAKTTRRLDYSVRLTQRGRYRLESLRTSTRFPFGLILYELTQPCENEVIVLPKLGRLSRRWHRLPMDMNQGSGRVQRRQATMEGDFYGLREWRSDDSRSWIHWRSSAKRQTLMVKQFEQQRSQNVRLVLDLWQPEQPQPEHLANVELAVSFAATIVADACHRGGATLWLTPAGSGITIRGPASPGLMQEALESLAVAQARSRDHLPETLAETLDEIRTGTRIVVISTRPVRLDDTQRFANIWRDQRRQAALGRVISIDCSQQELFQYFSAQ